MAFVKKSWGPNAFTFSNLGCGVMSVMMLFQANYVWAAIFVVLAALADRYDGKVARYLKVESPIGKELDSLADLISFGLAPAVLAFQQHQLLQWGLLGYALVILFPLCGAYRLARFNVTPFDGSFYGIPITFGGMALALYCLVTQYVAAPLVLTAAVMVVLAYLMVSRHRIPKF